MKCIFNHISYLPATCFGSYNCSHVQAELLRVMRTIGMLASYEIFKTFLVEVDVGITIVQFPF
jgi:hypothetical protein